VASPTWSSTEQVGRPATKRFHTSNWRSLETCCQPRTWWCNDATALIGYVKLMIFTSLPIARFCERSRFPSLWTRLLIAFLASAVGPCLQCFDTVGWAEHPACKNWVMRCWSGHLSGARCRLFVLIDVLRFSHEPFLVASLPTEDTQRCLLCPRVLLQEGRLNLLNSETIGWEHLGKSGN